MAWLWFPCGIVFTSLGSSQVGRGTVGSGLQEFVCLVLLVGSLPALSIDSAHRECYGNVSALPGPLLSPQSLINPHWLFLEGHRASLLEGQRSLWGITTWFGFFPFPFSPGRQPWGFPNHGSKATAPARCSSPKEAV